MEKAWQRGLVRTARGTLEAIGANADLILCNDPAWKGVLAYDAFKESVIFRREPPGSWLPKGRSKGRAWQDTDTTQLATWLSRTAKLHLKPSALDPVIDVVARRHTFHPIHMELESFTWDGKPRLDTWLIRLCGAPDTPYVREVSAKFMVSAVARVYKPGCQVDHVLVLEGEKGLGKSTLIKVLAGNRSWVLESLRDMHVEGCKSLRGKWFVDLAEMDHMTRISDLRQRAFLTTWADTYRDSYGRRVRDFPRQCVFTGSKNPPYKYLAEADRRYWPVRVRKVWLKHLKAERGQLWAEALQRYKNGEAWHITDKVTRQQAKAEQEKRRLTHPWEELISTHLRKKVKTLCQGFTTTDLFRDLGFNPVAITERDETRVVTILRSLGCAQRRARFLGDRRLLWFPSQAPKPPPGRPAAH